MYKGNKSLPLPSSACESQREADDRESVWVIHFLPPIPSEVSPLILQLNCYFVASIDSPLSVFKGNKSLPLPSSACESQREAGVGEFVWCIHFLPPIPHAFSPLIFQLNCYFVAGMEGSSSVIQSITMSSRPDDHLGDLDGEDELSDHEPHELTTDHGVTEDPKEVHEEDNSIDGIPTNLKNVWESGKSL